MINNNIGIIGSGQAAIALAAFFSKNGKYSSILYFEEHQGAIKKIKNGNMVQLSGKISGFFNIHELTRDASKFFNKNDVIFVVSPTYSHEKIMDNIHHFLEKKHNLVFVTGNFSSIVIKRKYKKLNCNLSEINLFPFACRLSENGIDILGVKSNLFISSYDPAGTDEIIEKIKPYFPSRLLKCRDVIEVGLNNVNGICHPIILLLNAGRIGKEDFYFNRDGVTEGVANFMDSVEDERKRIAVSLGSEYISFLDIMNIFYEEKFNSIHELFSASSVLNIQKLCPRSFNNRYLAEDVPYVLVPWLSLARMNGTESKAIETIIHLASIISKKNYFESGRILERAEIKKYWT